MIRSELKQLMQDKNLSYSVVARSLGISPSSLNQWMNDCYKGNSEKIELAVKSFIEKSIQRDYKTKSSFVMTSIAEDVFDVAKLCHLDSEIGVCYGPAGLGKTFAVKEYVKRNSDVILIEADLGYTTKILFSELHQLLGFEGIGSIHQMKKDIISKLQNSGRLIIVDEAEHLPYKALDLLRRIYDKANIGILLVGMPRLVKNLRGLKGQYAQLYSRVGAAKKLSSLTKADTELILQSSISDKKLAKTYHELSLGNARILSKLIARSVKVAQINELPLNAEVINETSKMLIV